MPPEPFEATPSPDAPLGASAGGAPAGSEGAGGEPNDVEIGPGVRVSPSVLRFSFTRSGGPGGQNVNKVATKAELRVRVDDLPLPGWARTRLIRLAGAKIVGARDAEAKTPDGSDADGASPGSEGHAPAASDPPAPGFSGEVLLTSETHRSQRRNREACVQKLRELVVEAMARPKIRRKTKPSRGAVERRLKEKRATGEKKSRRQRGKRGEE